MSLEKFIRLSDTIVEFEANLNDKRTDLSSSYIIETYKEEVKNLWERLRPVYEQCLCDMEEEEEVDESGHGNKEGKGESKGDGKSSGIEVVKSKYKSAFSSYCRCIDRLGVLLMSLSPLCPQPISNQHQGFKLPPCDIPVFSGDYASWPTFRDMFMAVCSNNPRLSAVEKLFHLNQRTKGEPNEIVKRFPLTHENFLLAWESLCTRYENKRVLINTQLKALFCIPTIQIESGNSLKSLQRDINACISMLRLYGIDVDSWDPLFVYVCSSRLPDVTLTLWEQTLDDKSIIPKWSSLDSFLTNRHRTLESVSEIRRKAPSQTATTTRQTSSKESDSKSSQRGLKAFQNKISDSLCRLCSKGGHVIRECPKFMEMSINQRLSVVKKFGLCLNCFSKVHSVKNCKSKFSCRSCNKRHNTLLHREQDSTIQSQSTGNVTLISSSTAPDVASTSLGVQSTNAGGSSLRTFFTRHSEDILLGTAVVEVRHNGLAYLARALIDSGSEGTFISERLFNKLKLPYRRISANISGLNETISASVHKKCSIVLGSIVCNDFEISTSSLVVPHLSGNLPSRTVNTSVLNDIPDIPLADPRFFQSSGIDILIGADILPSIMLSGVKQRICGSLLAQETVFGWVLTGPIHESGLTNSKPNATMRKVVSYFCETSVDKTISKFWEVESLPRKTFLSPSDQFCERLYVTTTTRNKDGRYIVHLPFKKEFHTDMSIGNSRNSAMAQFIRNEARLIRTPEFKLEYDEVIQEYIRLNHMSEVLPLKALDRPSDYYLPHHAVVKPESTTTKVRVVFNASSPSSSGTSLNDVLHTGPALQKDLIGLIIKWRFYRYVLNGDITKMYRQILVTPEHRRFQRILYRGHPNETIRDYQLDTVTFGVNCAPFLAIRTILQLAEDVRAQYPLASDILSNSMYVDDALAGAHTISNAIESRNQLILALDSAGFSMRKWTSNSKQILSDLPSDQLLSADFLEFDDRSTAKTLGIRWNASSDSFYFSVAPLSNEAIYTKRAVLSEISRLFDPAGWLAPCIVIAKLIMQTIWTEGTKWDEEISYQSLSNWKAFQSAYSSINSISVPRWFGYTPDSEVEFHGFCDASEKAYAAVLYVRIKNMQSISVHLVSSKTKVAPLKTLSIPRLELCGATLLADMIDNLIPQLKIPNYSIFCWTDSTIVLSWLAKPPSFWSTFVANRVSRIIEVVSPCRWYHVRSEFNPADLASRGVYPNDLKDDQLWWCGPQWLVDSSYPCQKSTSTVPEAIELERKTVKVNFAYFKKFEDVLERFSDFPRAVRVLAYVYRFLYATHPKFRSCFQKDSTIVSSSEIVMVQDRLISMTQKAHFPEEYLSLSTKKQISSTSPILSLNPFLDAEGIMRICGRLASSPALSYNERHPVILPYNCQFSRLIVKYIHSISIHGGNQLVLRLLRSRFWIIKAKNLIKTTINNCKLCVLYKKHCRAQIMSALPPERCELSRPFTHTGLDFTGPFDIKSYSGRCCRITKGYVCLFICFATKAIHLEATSDLSTSTFLAAFNRFVSRRGCPLHLHSDNGTNFVGASKTLAKAFIETSHQAIESNYALQNISWHFIPPGAPHMGGLWEAGVKSFKSHFRKAAGNLKHTFEEFQTLLAKIEACLNSRPLCPLSQEPSDLAALTPGHFLIGTPLLSPLDPNMTETSIALVNRWQRLNVVHQQFCIRWKDEYLKELHKRHKWKNPTENVKENALVVIREENLPPNCWRLGRVSKVLPGSDGRVRVVEIITEKGTITRPITKLILLPSDSSF